MQVLDFLDTSSLGAATRERVEPATAPKRRLLRLNAALGHLLLNSLAGSAGEPVDIAALEAAMAAAEETR